MIELIACPSAELKVDGNRARQILIPPRQAAIEIENGTVWAVLSSGERIRLVSSKQQMGEDALALKAPAKVLRQTPTELSGAELTWLSQCSPGDPGAVLSSLDGAFSFLQASADGTRPGLWIPQIGAIHAVLGHWTTESTDPATIVMPTGTGKTEAMIGLFATHRPERLLVVVPSDALREQIAEKFELLGVLQKTGVIDPAAQRPVVGRLYHRFQDAAAANGFAVACNVIVTTPSALLSPSNPEISTALLDSCSHLFVDEAHHVEAKTWRTIRDGFAGKPVLQFTATPFREDGQPLAGRQIYRYPLSVAQASGYFAEIDYTSVIELFDPDRAIGEAAIGRLRQDLDQGFDHVLMARVRTIARAKDLHERYLEFAADLNPVIVYSRMGLKRRDEALGSLLSRESRIVVCVDMLGEGFDLPALKVAAIHDAHKSLGVTLQFVGRFARVGDEQIGRASVFVGRPELDINHGLRRLYAEDADWNQMISDLSENRTRMEEEVGEFESGFGQRSDEVSIRALAPKMSTVVYRTHCADWNPEGILSVHPEETLLSRPLQVNLNAGVVWFVVRTESAVRWGDLPTVEEVSFDFFAVYWDKVNGLLYINTSNNASYPDAIAKAVCGENVELIRGTAVYRAMHGIQRLIPTNVGVLDVRDRDRRFTMYAGANVTAGMAAAEAGTKSQTNIFGSGFEEGERVSIGGSLKGRVWSYAAAKTLKHWVDWCDHVGPKLADTSISIKDVIGSFILPEELETLPNLVPLAVEWPIESYLNTSDEARLRFNGENVAISDAELAITDFSKGGPVHFELRGEEWATAYQGDIVDKSLVYRPTGPEAEIKQGLHDWIPFSEYLTSKSSGPMLIFEQDAVVVAPAILLQAKLEQPPFPVNRLQVPEWGEGMNIRKESQGRPKAPDSVQARTIAHIRQLHDWEIILDDDSSGEIADIVAIRKQDDELHVMLIHCKFSSDDEPGARVADLYEVCGQAQRSTASRAHIPTMFQKLIRRERHRVQKYARHGFEVGDIETLYGLQDDAHRLTPVFTIAIAQPGLSKTRASENQLLLLASTEAYVRGVAKADFKVYCSA